MRALNKFIMEATSFDSLSWQDYPHSSSCSTNEKVIKFSFLAKILQQSNPKSSPEHMILRPVKISRTSDRSEQQAQTSAKDILKRTIIRETSNKFGERTRENFMMKGKMLSGSKKPLENQMQSFLLCLNERITREAEKMEKAAELPSLGKQEFQTSDSSCNKKMHYQEIFKNLREMRLKKPSEQLDSPSPVKPVEKTRHRSRVERKSNNQTISYQQQDCSLSSEMPSLIKLPLPPVKPKETPFKKGYLPYDESARSFLQTYRENIKSSEGREHLRDLSAKAYLVLNHNTLTPLAGRNTTAQIQIASLTKIMTCYLSLLICQKYSVDIYTYTVRVSDKAAQTPGTSAELQNGDVLTLYQLMLGLMLPSGNDASVALAETMGKIIQRHRRKESKRSFYELFIAHMNFFSRELQLDQLWGNSSGLSLNPNYSSPAAIATLTCLAVRHPVFHRLVNTRAHELEVRNERFGLSRRVVWRNTNKLLQSGWQGVKTGTTDNAGHCLMARREQLLVCVFDCESNSRRFSECVRLFDKYRSSPST